ncbi:hypothetical protein [Flavobacterium sp.]|uniref:hypothetical protein n=1 Tax=Flavobacterium sp. TaxID=239 RepID=UPI003D6AA1B1
MKKLLMLAVLTLGTTAMVNAQTEPVKKVPAKEVKMKKNKMHHKTEKTEAKADETKAKK